MCCPGLLSRLRLAVAGLGKDTADEVTEVATLKANNHDIKWQVCYKRWCDVGAGAGGGVLYWREAAAAVPGSTNVLVVFFLA